MSDQINISFRIKNISTREFSIRNLPELDSVDYNNVKFQLNTATFIDKNAKVISIDTIVDIFIDQEQQKKVCELITRIMYEVVNLSDFISNETNELKFPQQFLLTLFSIAISTTRGILQVKTEGTLLNNFYLPIINPASFQPVEKNE